MSVSGNHILEINFIREIIMKSDKPELIEVLETIIKVADKIIEYGDFIDEYIEPPNLIYDDTESDDEYFPPTVSNSE